MEKVSNLTKEGITTGLQNNDLRRPTPFTELTVDCNSLSSVEFFPVVAVSQFSRCCSFQWGIRLDGRVGEVGGGIVGSKWSEISGMAPPQVVRRGGGCPPPLGLPLIWGLLDTECGGTPSGAEYGGRNVPGRIS
uniref:(California timema) hypothetical protein n=1 Tax=Timema californicum TaxID=61474 RepID=A0A7R9P8G4_TIMCA|nr:unnamed protein product [Timema californicum]